MFWAGGTGSAKALGITGKGGLLEAFLGKKTVTKPKSLYSCKIRAGDVQIPILRAVAASVLSW